MRSQILFCTMRSPPLYVNSRMCCPPVAHVAEHHPAPQRPLQASLTSLCKQALQYGMMQAAPVTHVAEHQPAPKLLVRATCVSRPKHHYANTYSSTG
jgi:hypothetical protein